MNSVDLEKTSLPLLETAREFQGLPREALRWIAGGCHARTVPRDQLIYDKGQTLSGFYMVVSGRVKLAVLSPGGAERVLDIVLPGQTFAESAAFLGRPCPLSAQALTDSQLLFVDLSRVRRAIERWPEVAFRMLTLLAERSQRLTADLEACCLQSAAQRVAGLLLREAASDPALPDCAELTLPASKAVMASSLNLSPETFSRELHALARKGLIEVKRRVIRIPSLRTLRSLATMDPRRIQRPEPGGAPS